MKAIETTAHFDETGLLKIDNLPKIINQKVKVLILIEEQADWYKFSSEGLVAAYDENEPDYNLASLKESNSEYQPTTKND